MSCDVSVKKLNYQEMLKRFRKRILDSEPDEDLSQLEKYVQCFGTVVGEEFIIMNNEHADECNPYFQLSNFIDRHYCVEDSFDDYYQQAVSIEHYLSADDVAEQFEIELAEEIEE